MEPGSANRRRDRRGRGPRGPAIDVRRLPAELPRPPRSRSRREAFDRLVLDVVAEIESRWGERLGLVEYAVEEAPSLPDDWESVSVPLASLVRGQGSRPTRLVVFRQPLEHRAETRDDLEALVLTVVVEQVAELLGLPPEDVDPRYGPDD